MPQSRAPGEASPDDRQRYPSPRNTAERLTCWLALELTLRARDQGWKASLFPGAHEPDARGPEECAPGRTGLGRCPLHNAFSQTPVDQRGITKLLLGPCVRVEPSAMSRGSPTGAGASPRRARKSDQRIEENRLAAFSVTRTPVLASAPLCPARSTPENPHLIGSLQPISRLSQSSAALTPL